LLCNFVVWKGSEFTRFVGMSTKFESSCYYFLDVNIFGHQSVLMLSWFEV
jgi:hypothetical protein